VLYLAMNVAITRKLSGAITLMVPDAKWRSSHITGYVASHLWRDFAETWAHYLHIVDTMEMAFSFGVQAEPRVDTKSELVLDFDPHPGADFDLLIGKWLSLMVVINSLSRCP
jgi:hypothetical protein